MKLLLLLSSIFLLTTCKPYSLYMFMVNPQLVHPRLYLICLYCQFSVVIPTLTIEKTKSTTPPILKGF